MNWATDPQFWDNESLPVAFRTLIQMGLLVGSAHAPKKAEPLTCWLTLAIDRKPAAKTVDTDGIDDVETDEALKHRTPMQLIVALTLAAR